MLIRYGYKHPLQDLFKDGYRLQCQRVQKGNYSMPMPSFMACTN